MIPSHIFIIKYLFVKFNLLNYIGIRLFIYFKLFNNIYILIIIFVIKKFIKIEVFNYYYGFIVKSYTF